MDNYLKDNYLNELSNENQRKTQYQTSIHGAGNNQTNTPNRLPNECH